MHPPNDSEAPTFTNNPEIAREIENEKQQPLSDSEGSTKAGDSPNGLGKEKVDPDNFDKIEITEADCYDELGFSYPTWKKWMILTVIFLVQVSMNFNTSLYGNAVSGISEEFGVSAQAARCGAMIFLVFYAFGCELWAPWSEEFGRKPIIQASLFLVNIWQLPVASARPTSLPSWSAVLWAVLSTAGGSVTLGMIADMWEADTQQYAVAYVVFSSVWRFRAWSNCWWILRTISRLEVCNSFHTTLSILANFSTRWCIWIQLIFGVFIQIRPLSSLVPETRTTIIS